VHRLPADPTGSICWSPYSIKCLVISLMQHRVSISFKQWPVVPFVFSFNINNSSALTRDSPLKILNNNSIKYVYIFSHRESTIPNTLICDRMTYPPYFFMFVNLRWIFSINSLRGFGIIFLWSCAIHLVCKVNFLIEKTLKQSDSIISHASNRYARVLTYYVEDPGSHVWVTARLGNV